MDIKSFSWDYIFDYGIQNRFIFYIKKNYEIEEPLKFLNHLDLKYYCRYSKYYFWGSIFHLRNSDSEGGSE